MCGLDTHKAHETALKLHAHSVLYMHKLTTTRRALEKPVALKVLVWSRGLLVTLRILISSSFSLVEETHGSLGQCISFSLIDVGSGFTAYVVFLFFLCFGCLGELDVRPKLTLAPREAVDKELE